MSEAAVVAKKGPFGVVVDKGEIYWWCTCGRSSSQPFCDGSPIEGQGTAVCITTHQPGITSRIVGLGDNYPA